MRSSIHSARAKLADLRAALLASCPETLSAQIADLEQCAHALKTVQPYELDELIGLSKDLHHTRALLEHGMNLQLGWARMLAASSAEYRPDGEPRALEPQGTVSIRG